MTTALRPQGSLESMHRMDDSPRSPSVASHGLRTETLEDLSDPSAASFGHIDDVCIQLLKQGQTTQALKYLQRMRAMIDSIVDKMGGDKEEAEQPPRGGTGRKPKPPSRASRSARGLRTARMDKATAEVAAPETARSLPSIPSAIVPVDTAAERLAAKDLFIATLQEQKAKLEAREAAKDDEVRAARDAAADAVAKLRKRDGDVKNMRAMVRTLEQEATGAQTQADTLRATLESERAVEAAAVTLEEYDDMRKMYHESQDRVKKLEGQVRQRDGKLKLVHERLEFAQKDAGMASAAKELSEALQDVQGKLDSKNRTAKTSAKMLQRREAELKELQNELTQAQSELLSTQGTLQERDSELRSVTKRLDKTMEDYKGFRAMTVKLTAELDGSDSVRAERDSLRAQLNDASEIITKTAMKVEKYEHKVKASGVELHNSAKAMKELTTSLDDTKEQLVKKTADTVTLRKQIGPLRQEIERLQVTIMEKDEHIEQLSDTSGKRMAKVMSELERYKAEASRIPELESELTATKDSFETTKRILDDLKEKFDQQAAANKEVGDFMAERNSWARKVMRLSIEPQLLRQRLAVQSNTMKFLEDEVARLEARAVVRELVDVLADEHSAALTKELGETREVVAALRRKGSADEAELGERATIITRIEKEKRIMEGELDTLRRSEEVKADVAELEAQLADEKQVAEAAREEAVMESARSANLDGLLEKEKGVVAEKLEQIGTLEASLAETTEQAQASGAELAVQQAAVAKLEAQLTESRTETKELVAKRDEMLLSIEDGEEMQTFLLAEIAQLKSVVDNTREEVRKELDISKEKDRRFANAGAELAKTKQLMTEEKEFAVAFEANEREKMRLALTEIIVQRESTITELCVVISDTRTEANTLVSEVARLEGQVAVMTEELAEAVVPIVVTVEEQQAVAETVEEMITLIELLDRVESRQTQLYPSGAATTNTPQPTATPDIVEHDYSRAMANPVVSVRMVRGKRLFSI